MKTNGLAQRVLIIVLLFGVLFLLPRYLKKSQSANLTSVSDTLSSSRLSFYGLMASGNTVGATLVTINTTTAPSTSSSQLASPSASTVKIGSTVYNLSNVMPNSDQSKFSVSTGLSSGDETAGNAIIASQSASHTVRFNTVTAVPDGAIRILVQATTNTGSSDDGIPDGDGFDFGATAPSIACPSDDANYDFVTGTATAQAVTISTVKYHAFECRYSGTGAATSFQSNPVILTSLINPAPKSGHAVGVADTYSVIVQQLDYAYSTIDQTSMQVGAIESVRVSATVASQITFKIAGIPSGSSGNNACGSDTSVTTTATTIPFGQLAISTFSYAAQSLEISTNAIGGYAVTAQQNNQLRIPSTATYILDTTGDNTDITYGSKGKWDSTSAKGFGYSLKKISAAGTAAFERTDTDANCVGASFCAKQFPDLSNSEPAQTILSSSTVADAENIDVCYKVIISNSQSDGTYENNVIYTATATF
ncbi:MAG TPA: hypothetical protein VJ246_01040 [Patescibacteria group bacterium]|nr:hypothetical protein [Patescibacteria group bacterium]